MLTVKLIGYKENKQIKKTIKGKNHVEVERKIIEWSTKNRINTFVRQP